MFSRRSDEPVRPFSPYRAFVVEEMILRDHLAVDRTALANERTLLSYARTALGCVIGGASALHFLSGLAADAFGVLLMLVGVGAFGAYRYHWYKRRIEVVVARSELAKTPEPDAN